jgi:GLPGLI family protein
VRNRLLSALFLSILPLFVLAQPKGVEFRYTSTFPLSESFLAIEDETVRSIILQRIKDDKKVYTLTVDGNKYLFSKDSASVDKMPLEVDYLHVYLDFDNLIKTSQIKYNGKLYLVSDSLLADEWVVSDTLDTIQGRVCHKATLKQDKAVVAWFDPEIAVNCAPFGYTGLPGLVVRMELPFAHLNLQSLHSVDNVSLSAPVKGKKLDSKRFKQLVDNNFSIVTVVDKLVDNCRTIKTRLSFIIYIIK